jgi:hypothetical protein
MHIAATNATTRSELAWQNKFNYRNAIIDRRFQAKANGNARALWLPV